MSKLLYIQASPRAQRSKSMAVADAFIEMYQQGHRGDLIETLNVCEADLIAFDGLALQAKYTILHGKEHTKEETSGWKAMAEAMEKARQFARRF